MIGKILLIQDPFITKQLWTIARMTYSDMGLLYHESASLEFYILNNATEARRIINECMSVPPLRFIVNSCSQTFLMFPTRICLSRYYSISRVIRRKIFAFYLCGQQVIGFEK